MDKVDLIKTQTYKMRNIFKNDSRLLSEQLLDDSSSIDCS